MVVNNVPGKSGKFDVDEEDVGKRARFENSESMREIYVPLSEVMADTNPSRAELVGLSQTNSNVLKQVSEAPFQEEVRPMGETGHSGTRRRKRYSSCVLRNDESSANASPVLSGSDVDSELSAEGSLYNSMKRIYQKYCEEAEAKSDMKLVKLTWDEYFTQQSIDDDEFNPEDTLESILSEIEDSPWPKEIKESMFRQMAHRFRR